LAETIVEINGLSKTYRAFMSRRSHRALNALSIDVRRGEVFGLVGPNGSGKTTTLKLLLGLLLPTAGRVTIFGRDPRDVAVKHRIGFLPDGPYFYDHLNAVELLDFYGRLFGFTPRQRKERTEELLELVGMTKHRNRPVREYSKGMTQRVGLAQALINDPDLLLLDEPTTGLDPLAAFEIKETVAGIKARGKTVFLCSHLLADVQASCDRVAILNEGERVRFGPVSELLAADGADSLEQVFIRAVRGSMK
jgi:ABC-2 type transport system ATP-binding protein